MIPCTVAYQACLFSTVSWELAQIHVHWVRWCCPTILSSAISFSFNLQPFPASESFPMRWLSASGGQFWSFSFSISPSNEYPRLISFRNDWLYFLAIQETLKSFLQRYNLKHQFFSGQPHLWSNFLICTWLLERPYLEKEMAAHLSILAWRIPRTEKPSGLWPMGSQSQTRLTN